MIAAVYNSKKRKLIAHGPDGPIVVPGGTLAEQFRWIMNHDDVTMTSTDIATIEAILGGDEK